MTERTRSRDRISEQDITAKLQTFSVWKRIEKNPLLSDVILSTGRLIERLVMENPQGISLQVYEKRYQGYWAILFLLQCPTCEYADALQIWKSVAHSVQEQIKQIGPESSKYVHRIRIEVRGREELQRRGTYKQHEFV